jgi:peroxiredoxin
LKADGKKAKLEDYKGQTIYLEFWDSQCADWVKNAKLLKKRHQEFKNKNIVFLYVNLDKSQQKWKKIIRKRKPKGTQLFQSDLDIYNSRIDEAFSVSTLPASALIDSKGKILVSPAQKMDIEATLNKARTILH